MRRCTKKGSARTARSPQGPVSEAGVHQIDQAGGHAVDHVLHAGEQRAVGADEPVGKLGVAQLRRAHHVAGHDGVTRHGGAADRVDAQVVLAVDGNGDLVKMLSDSCRKHGLKFGIYIAPWDRHEKSYGSGKDYDDFLKSSIASSTNLIILSLKSG